MLFSVNGLSMSEMFYFRYKAGLLNYREHRFSYYFRASVYLTRAISLMDICFCILTFSDGSEFQQNYRATLVQTNPLLPFLSCPNTYSVVPFADYVSTIVLASWICQTVNLTVSIPLAVGYMSENVPKSISPATWKIQQQLMWSLTIQAGIHGIMLGVPNAMFIYALFFGFIEEAPGYAAFVFLTYHGFLSAFSMIICTRPIREYLLRAVKIKKYGSASVSVSKTTK
ncbi:hypothetical protein L3Y34_006369 [Caenorhabditis briggsae]|uniref:Uncharacterized protein n=1 Tax=Caenorhabditis briggsae TaxID=6238 RepID=A0AAE9A448_CAEBR|nr:hypothetical protein L3Y34_006369 [Caenorhabditis briggsae]